MENTSGSSSAGEPSRWTPEEDKLFERCLVEFAEDSADRWHKIAARLGTKSPAEVEQHYAVLLEDLAAIENGSVESPAYAENDAAKSSEPQMSVCRRARTPWTEEEHRLFLEGLEKYGKGDWKSISKYSVISRSRKQVASYAYNYFKRQGAEEETSQHI